MPFTSDQQNAIDARGVNLLVAAAAGSGKTTVLVERVLRLVQEGANVDEMLIVTFTRAASSDMRAKLSKRFAELAGTGDARAREQMERLESASICTLHAFCSDVIRQNFEAAEVDPQFRILDDAENSELIDHAMDDALEYAYELGGADMDALDFARGSEKVRELALSMYFFLLERPDPDAWMADTVEKMNGDGAEWTQTLLDAARKKLSEALALNTYAIGCGRMKDGPDNYADSMEEDGRVLEALCTLDYDRLREGIAGFKQLKPKSVRKKSGYEPTAEEVELKNEVTNLRKQVKSRVEAAAKLVELNREQSLKDIRDNIPVIQKLYEIALDLGKRLREMKSARAALTFSDLEHLALRCLNDERIASRVRDSYQYIFVDEYQDTSDVQEAIVTRIARPNNRFMVGDVKQSIYRFRQAEPRLFLEKYAQYQNGGENRLIVLKQNFRSRSCVIDFVNSVFSRVMNGGASEIVYDEDAMLYRGKTFETPDSPVELHLIDKANEDAEEDAEACDEEEEELNDAEREGILIARRIHELKKEDPNLRYRDICVLTRVRVNALSYLAASLSAEGIPAYADASECYFDALEVMEVMSCLRLIANRRHDIDLISVLRSPMVGMTSVELAQVRAQNNADSFREAVEACAGEKAQRFLKLLGEWRVLSRAMPLSKLIRRVLNDTDFYTYVGALPGGAQRQANLDVLCARAAAYEAAVGGSLSAFLDYAAGMKARGDAESAHVLGENDDVVRLMTVHKSKGLEFNVVFCALLGRNFKTSRADDTLAFHRDFGVSLMRMDQTLQTRRDTLARRAIVQKRLFEDRAEELRILYVMLTRAQNRLILTGSVRNLSACLTSLKIFRDFPDIYSNALDIVGAAALTMRGSETVGGQGLKNAPEIRIKTYSAKSLKSVSPGEEENTGLKLLEEAVSAPETDEKLRAALEWKYPFAEGVNAPVKLTASGLSREVIGVEAIPDILERPRFLSETKLTSTERGTAIHAALRALDYETLPPVSDDEALRREVNRQMYEMARDGRLSPAEAKAVPPKILHGFLASPLGQRVRACERMEREWRFNLRMPASEALPEYSGSGEVIVQGSIDLCFLEKGEWVLVDYKTDRADDREKLLERYVPQLKLYALALERITGTPVKEALLCLLAQGENLTVEI